MFSHINNIIYIFVYNGTNSNSWNAIAYKNLKSWKACYVHVWAKGFMAWTWIFYQRECKPWMSQISILSMKVLKLNLVLSTTSIKDRRQDLDNPPNELSNLLVSTMNVVNSSFSSIFRARNNELWFHGLFAQILKIKN